MPKFPICRHFGPHLAKISPKTQLNQRQNTFSRQINHTIYSPNKFKTDFAPKIPIFRDFGQISNQLCPKIRSNERQNTFLCPKSDSPWNFTWNTVYLQIDDEICAENIDFQAFWPNFDRNVA